MADKLDIPDELLHLIEKRDQADRRAAEHTVPTAPVAAEVPDDAPPMAADDRRSGQERRNP